MSAFLGADVLALEHASATISTRREAIVALLHEVSAEVDSIAWYGPDAETLRTGWVESLGRLVAIVEEALADMSSQANAQAAEQRSASEV